MIMGGVCINTVVSAVMELANEIARMDSAHQADRAAVQEASGKRRFSYFTHTPHIAQFMGGLGSGQYFSQSSVAAI